MKGIFVRDALQYFLKMPWWKIDEEEIEGKVKIAQNGIQNSTIQIVIMKL